MAIDLHGASTIQEFLFIRALYEENIEVKELSYSHGFPECYNNRLTYNFVFPKSWLEDVKKLDYTKSLDYIFLGTIQGEHRQFLLTWDKPNSLIRRPAENGFIHPRHDPNGYYPDNFFNIDYYQQLASSKFTLAPAGCSYDKAFYERYGYLRWTYRFWEAVLVKSIPITNEPDPRNHTGYKFYSLEDEHIYREDWVEHNFNLLKERHFIWNK